MKKTILLMLAFLARILTMGGGVARRGDNKRGKCGDINFLPAFAVVCIATILATCGGKVDSAKLLAGTDGSVAEIKRLIDNGIDINAKDRHGNTALHIVPDWGKSKTGLALIKAGADIHAKDNYGQTPLHAAAGGNNLNELVRALIKAGADIHAKDNDGKTPLHHATFDEHRSGQNEVVSALIQAGADIEAKNHDGETPLHEAVNWGKAETVLALIQAGADIYAKDNNGETPLDIALIDEKAAIVLVLTAAHIKDSWTPLHLAVANHDTAKVNSLLNDEVDIEAKDFLGRTPLHLAAAEGQAKIAFSLVKAGADLYAVTDHNKTALEIAMEAHKADSGIVIFLQGAMAKTPSKDQQEAEELLRELE